MEPNRSAHTEAGACRAHNTAMNSHTEPTEGLSPFHPSEKIHLQYLLLGDGNVFFPGRADLGFVAAVPGAGTEYELHV